MAVIGTPLGRCYPSEHRELQRHIAREQLLISPFRDGEPVMPRNFPVRNRTMALLTDAPVIVEAGEKTGTLVQTCNRCDSAGCCSYSKALLTIRRSRGRTT